MTANATGRMMAPPIPIAARAAITTPAVSAHAAATEARPNRARPISISRLRPYRSASAPNVSIVPASTST